MRGQEHYVAVGVVDVDSDFVKAILIEHDVIVQLFKDCREEVHHGLYHCGVYLRLDLAQVLQTLGLKVFPELETL